MNPMPPAAPTITSLQLETAASALGSMAAFSGDLGLDVSLEGETSLSLRVGDARLQFTAANGEPFYHLALLVPGDRFDAAYAWATERIALLDGPGGSRAVDFADWQAKALYLLDPAGNIVELIAHSGVEKARRPAGTPASRPVAHTVTQNAQGPVTRLFDEVVAEDVLPKVLRRYLLVPAVVGTEGLTGPWSTPGSQRRVRTSDGRALREEVTVWQRPHSFGYRVEGFTGIMGHLVNHAVGHWTFSGDDSGSAFSWTYTFFARTRWAAPIVAAFIRLMWSVRERLCCPLRCALRDHWVIRATTTRSLIAQRDVVTCAGAPDALSWAGGGRV